MPEDLRQLNTICLTTEFRVDNDQNYVLILSKYASHIIVIKHSNIRDHINVF